MSIKLNIFQSLIWYALPLMTLEMNDMKKLTFMALNETGYRHFEAWRIFKRSFVTGS